jgi:hypothetical protein
LACYATPASREGRDNPYESTMMIATIVNRNHNIEKENRRENNKTKQRHNKNTTRQVMTGESGRQDDVMLCDTSKMKAELVE